jgi:acetylornithine deacetylase/succinyl-diaminopimelate desuccinylase-like protein
MTNPAQIFNMLRTPCRSHLDKQPPLEAGWSAGLGPWKPVIQDKDGHPYLYGRGGVDDGYAPFAALLAIKVSEICGA